MKTRIGKIAQLPKLIRHQLNQRLENGKQGPELLPWLNELPETKQLLAEKFDSQPITKSNLSDWRQGGYQDWLRLQTHEARIQRVVESGGSLQQLEGKSDLFENFARLVVSELAVDLEALDQAKNPDQRWQRLRELSRELARLQNSYNRSRWAELAWTRRNDRFEVQAEPAPQCDHQPEAPAPEPQEVPGRAQSSGTEIRFLHHAPCGCVCRKCHAPDGHYPFWDAERDAAHRDYSGFVRQDNGESFYLENWTCDCTCKRCDSKNGQQPEAGGKPRKSVFRIIHSLKWPCDGVCQKCHAPDSEYPLAEVTRDLQLFQETQSSILRGNDGISTCLRFTLCNCTCEPCEREETQATAAADAIADFATVAADVSRL